MVVPADIPVTTPPATLAVTSLLVQLPPGAGSVNTIDEPTQTVDGPVMTPALGNGLMVITIVAVAVPQTLVTE